MYDTDFQVQWNDDAEDAYAWPVEHTFSEEVLPAEYSLAVNESKSGLLVYEVPEGNDDFSVSFMEFFEDESEGDLFFVYFTADRQ